MIEKLIFRKHNYELEKQVSEANAEARSVGKKQAVFYITKPLQYINARATGGIQEKNFNILILSNAFVGAEDFYKRVIEHDAVWDKIIFSGSNTINLSFLANMLFLFDEIVEFWTTTDVGTFAAVYLYKLHKRNTKIILIEEGVGNYVLRKWNFMPVSDYIPPFWKRMSQPFFNFINFLIGSGTSLGCCRWTDAVYLYYPDYPSLPCRRKKVYTMKSGACEQFTKMSFLFPLNELAVIKENFAGKKILIAATEWDGTCRIEEDDFSKYDIIILKLHPHIRENFSVEDKRFHLLQTFIPTEVLALELLKNNEVTLRSKYSSSMFYLHRSNVVLEFECGVPEFLKNFVDYVYDTK